MNRTIIIGDTDNTLKSHNDMKSYLEFLETKKRNRIESGFKVEESQLNPSLFPFQKYCVQRALLAGKFALFEDCGLGKTIQQLEWAHHVSIRTQKPILILAPLGVIPQTIKEGEHKHPIHCNISVDTWQKYASPVWMDIDYSNTLNASRGRGENDEKHICPLQLETIARAVTLWSNEGDIVLTPFLGIGSEVYQSILLGRKGIGFELKDSYFNEAARNVKEAEFTKNQKTLF